MEAALILLGQGLSEVGVGNTDEILGTVLQGASLESGDTVFGNNIVDIVSRGAHGSTFGEEGFTVVFSSLL